MGKKEIFWHTLSISETEKKLNTDLFRGLGEDEIKKRHQISGFNKLPEEKPTPALKLFLKQLESPLIYILVAAGIATLLLKDYTDSFVIWIVIALNSVLGFFQENKASKILTELKKIIKIKAYVIRNENEKEINQSELVPGDIFLLHPGNKIPADGRLIESFHLKINEAHLTGEWLPAEKKIETLALETLLAGRNNMVYMGCVVEEGQGKAVVVAIGEETEIGRIASLVEKTEEEKTPYQKKLLRLSNLVGIWVIFASFLIFALGLWRGIELIDMFIMAVAVAVGAVPEGLPVAVTIILALGMQRILKKKGLVRKMTAAEALGSTSIICTDKTGTLTEAKMQVAGIFTGQKELLSDGVEYSEVLDKDGVESHILALKIAVLCNGAFIENSDEPLEKWIIRGKPTEKALLLAGIQAGLNKKELEEAEPKIEDKFFDPAYKYAASRHRFSDNEDTLYLIGAPEVILEMSEFLDVDGRKEILSFQKKEELVEKFEKLAGLGQRILAAAYRKIQRNGATGELENYYNGLIFVGFIALHDPLRKEVKESLKICFRAGIKTIIVTGDHKMTARAIALELKLPAGDENIIEGLELDKLNDEELRKKIENVSIFARVEPKQKLRIVQALQERREVVAMTGDGINDTPALKKSDIGIVLGSGTDAAKEVSDLVLLNDNFSIIVVAVEEGRRIIDNIRKTITIFVSQSFSEIILVGATIAAGLPLPILPIQILWENLIEGGPQGIALAFEPKEEDVMSRKPEHPQTSLLTRQMKVIIFGFGIITDFILVGLFLWLLNKELPMPEIRTIIFAVLAIDSLFCSFSCRNLRKNIWHYNPFSNIYLIISIAFSVLMLLAAIYMPFFQKLLGTQPLNYFAWFLISVLGMLNLVLIEAIKYYFIAKEKNHLKKA